MTKDAGMDIEEAIRLAQLWRAGKMIGGDEDTVRDALLAEVERLRGAPVEPRADAAKLEEIAKWHEEVGANHHAELEATRDRIDWSSQGLLRDRGDFHKEAAQTIRNAQNREAPHE